MSTPSPDRDCLQSIDILVLAGGLGTRIRPVLGDTPKLLAPVAGRPVLSYLLQWLRRFGARRVVLGLGHRAAAVGEYLRAHPPSDMEVEAVIEPKPLGTAGAIRFARPHLRTDPVLVMNGDSFIDADICALIARHRALGTSGTILCASVADAARYGRIVLGADGRIQNFAEKDARHDGPALVNAGVYVLSGGLLNDIAAGGAVSLELDVFGRLPQGALGALAGDYRFIDIGTPEALAAAAPVLGSILEPNDR